VVEVFQPLRNRSIPPGFSETAVLVNHLCPKRALNEREELEVLVCLSPRRLRVQFGFAVYLDTFLDEKVEALRENLFLSGSSTSTTTPAWSAGGSKGLGAATNLYLIVCPRLIRTIECATYPFLKARRAGRQTSAQPGPCFPVVLVGALHSTRFSSENRTRDPLQRSQGGSKGKGWGINPRR
jgi:hypothetical protein